MRIKIGRYTALVIVLALFFSSLQYARHFYVASEAPEGYIFGLGQEQVTFLAAMNSHIWEFKMPYGATEMSYFQNSWIGSLYYFAFLGMLSKLLAMDAFVVFSAFNLAFSFLYLIIIYYLVKVFAKDEKKAVAGLLFFMIASAGIGGLLYLFFKTPVEAFNPDAFLFLLGRGGFPVINGSLHWVTALTFAYLAFFYTKENNQNNKKSLGWEKP